MTIRVVMMPEGHHSYALAGETPTTPAWLTGSDRLSFREEIIYVPHPGVVHIPAVSCVHTDTIVLIRNAFEFARRWRGTVVIPYLERYAQLRAVIQAHDDFYTQSGATLPRSLFGRPRMPYEWTDEQYAVLPQAVQDVRDLLEEWFNDIQAGTVTRRLPDPFYKPEISLDIANQVVTHLDAEFDKEIRAWAGLVVAGEYKVNPGFHRLAPPQRIALAQAIHVIKLKHKPRFCLECTHATHETYPCPRVIQFVPRMVCECRHGLPSQVEYSGDFVS